MNLNGAGMKSGIPKQALQKHMQVRGLPIMTPMGMVGVLRDCKHLISKHIGQADH